MRHTPCLQIPITLLALVAFTAVSVPAQTVMWDPNQEADIAGYRVYYGPTAENLSTHADVGNTTTYRPNLDWSQRWYFAVQAYDTANQVSPLSSVVEWVPSLRSVLAASVTFPVAAGTPVTWTATATGGVGPHTFKFWVYNGATWSVGQEWGTANTWTWQPPLPGRYRVQVWVRNAGSVATYDAWSGAEATISVSRALTVTSLTPSAAEVAAGTPVTWTATAAGGVGPYTFKFWVYNGVTWSVGQEWGTANTWTWEPPLPGRYRVQVWVRNAGSVAEYDAWLGAEATISVSRALTVTSLTPSAAEVAAGTPVTWTATAAGGVGPYTFKFWLYDGTAWTLGQDWSSAPTWSWTPPAAGTFGVQVWARDAGSNAPYDGWRNSQPYTALRPPALTVTTLAADRLAPVSAGTPVTWTATAAGGTRPHAFKFWVYDGSNWSVGRDWGSAPTWTWVPPDKGSYRVRVWARDAGSTADYDAWHDGGAYPVTAAAPLRVGLLATGAFPVAAGTPVQWTALAVGGRGPYTFKFWVYDGAAWSVGRDWSGAPTWTWAPPAAGTYWVQAWARNAGSVATQDAWVNAGPLEVGTATALAIPTLTLAPMAPLVAGEPTVITARSSGGTGPHTYQFWVFDGATWTIGQAWSPAHTFTWVPPAAGTYAVQVWVRNAGSTAPYDQWQGRDRLTVLP